jgi:hypothetical protein
LLLLIISHCYYSLLAIVITLAEDIQSLIPLLVAQLSSSNAKIQGLSLELSYFLSMQRKN